MIRRKGRKKVRLAQRGRAAYEKQPTIDRDDPKVKRGCLGKKGQYRSRSLAKLAASAASKKHKVKFRSYHCRVCGLYHLSTVKTVVELKPE